ncbi:MAG: S8 family serine peptidase [Planctomycetota bacterium]
MIPSLSLAAILAVSATPVDVQDVEVGVTTDPSGTEIRLTDGTLVHRTRQTVQDVEVLSVGADGDLVARWTESDGRQSTQRYALRLDPAGQFSRVRDASPILHLKRGRFDPIGDGAPEIADGLEASGDLYIVQFHTQPIDAYTEVLEGEGATVRHFLPETSRLVEMDAATAAQVEDLPFVRWVGPYSAFYRVEQPLLDGVLDGTYEPARLHVQVTERGPDMKSAVAARVRALGADVVWIIDEGFRFDAVLDAEQLVTVASWDEVLWIDRWSAPEEDMDKVRADGGADALEGLAGFTGNGVRAEAMDGNVDTNHVDLQSNPVILHGPRAGSDTHGTPVTGIVFGDGAGNAARRGLLPDGQPIFADFGQLSNRYQHTAELLQAPYFAVFQTNSWGSSRTSQYTSVSMEMDDILFDNDIVILQSQSNAGSTQSRPQAWAKNIVAVGGVRHQDTLSTSDDAWAGSASIGPAQDGRLKPDLSYWYDAIFTAQSGNGSTNFGGTSAATPMTAGFFGLFYEAWHAGVFGNTPGASVFESRPKATLARAFMINTASRYAFSGAGADLTRTHQGWGRANVERLYEARDSVFWVNESEVISETESVIYPLIVEPNTPELAITMVYLDFPATTSSSLHRINDLSLRVTAPGAVATYWGNNGLRVGNESTSGGSSNTRDVVENVFVTNPAAGVWTVEIIADDINADAHVETPENDADFALVVRGTSGLGGDPCVSPEVYCLGEPNSFSVLGAQLSTTGSTSIGANNLSLLAFQLPPFTSALVARSETQASTPVGDGTLCLGGNVFRIAVVQADFIGTASYSIDVTTAPTGAMILSGSTWNYQLWYRDIGGPGGTGFNFTDAVEVLWCD